MTQEGPFYPAASCVYDGGAYVSGCYAGWDFIATDFNNEYWTAIGYCRKN
jgi:hypothetical protein